MAMGIEISWKNRLQEHCQKNQLPMPNYRFKQQSNALCQLSFQAEVEINGRWYIGNDNFPSKKAAEQSAAEKACNDLCNSDVEFHTANENVDANQHMPREHAYIERFLTNMLAEHGGQIRKVHPPNDMDCIEWKSQEIIDIVKMFDEIIRKIESIYLLIRLKMFTTKNAMIQIVEASNQHKSQ
ncbi:hypothetical protein I4U23_002934 [Adineta vaga]|nr:hypothetical protein I4U23_002934 [Adineta vaga]